MEIFKFFLTIHIIGGTLGLLAGTYIMLAKKGDNRHKLIGKIFAISMLGAGICSLVLAIIHHINFLFAVGVFTIYLVSTGWRFLSLKNIANGQKPKIIDWGLMAFMIVGSVTFLVIGTYSLLNKEYFGIIIFIFAFRGVSLVIQDYRTFKGQITVKNYWLINHLQRMTGAYIASLTAFTVVNAPNRLSFLPWLLPALIFIPLLIKWTRKYSVKLADNKTVANS